MSFKLSDFTALPSQELLDLAKKSDLLDIADHYGLLNVRKDYVKTLNQEYYHSVLCRGDF